MKILFFLILMCSTCFGAVFSPDHVNSQIDIDSHGQIDSLTNNITACLWLSKDAAAVHFGGDYFLKARSGQFRLKDGSGPFDWDVNDHAGGESLWRGTIAWTATNTIIFVALTFTYTDTNSFKLYSNGVSMAGTWINNPTNAAGVSNNAPISLGGGQGGAGRMTGYYSDFTLWNSILTQQQLELIRNSHVKGIVKQISPSTLRMYMPLDGVPDAQQAGSNGRFPDRGAFVPYPGYAPNPGANTVAGMAERICSYPPNE